MEAKQSSFGLHLSDTLLLMRKYLSLQFQNSNSELRFEDWMALLPVWERPGISQKELSEALVRDKTTISRLVDVWVNKAWVERKADPNDKRLYRLYLSTKGEKVWKKGLPLVEDADRVFRSGLTSQEEKTFYQLLFQLRSSVLLEMENSNH
ncbi:MarR family winged helix-turn-helix transcriptional regulator [Leptospira ryugenii]|nr:MarR family transcriptional regulator [Leptospira ryugenii]